MFNYQSGTTVLNTNGNTVGEVVRVVMNPHTHKVSHLVIRKGFLFTEDKVLSIDMVDKTDNGKLVLAEDNLDVEALPPFKEEHFVPAGEIDNEDAVDFSQKTIVPSLYLYPPVDGGMMVPMDYGLNLPQMVRYEEYNVPSNTIALKPNANVITADGKHVGQVEEIMVDDDSKLASHFVISRGMFFKHHKLIPTIWIDSIMENNVHLTMKADFLKTLPEYKGEKVVTSQA